MLDRFACVTDSFGNPAGHRPGYAFANDQYAVDTKRQAYADYDNDLTNAWRNEQDDGDFGSGDLGNGREGDVCTCRDAEYRLDFGAPGHIRNGVCVPDRPRKPQKRRDAMNAKQLVRDHRQRMMQECYTAYDREIVEMWRCK